MAFIPKDAKWYLADLVIAISVGQQRRIVVHINTVLVRADSPDEAYDRALEIGKHGQIRYENLAGEEVRFRFLGLRELTVIHEEFEHGAELSFQERHVRSVGEAKDLVTPKRKLGVFRPITPSRGPDYASADVMRELHARFVQMPQADRRRQSSGRRRSKRQS